MQFSSTPMVMATGLLSLAASTAAYGPSGNMEAQFASLRGMAASGGPPRATGFQRFGAPIAAPAEKFGGMQLQQRDLLLQALEADPQELYIRSLSGDEEALDMLIARGVMSKVKSGVQKAAKFAGKASNALGKAANFGKKVAAAMPDKRDVHDAWEDEYAGLYIREAEAEFEDEFEGLHAREAEAEPEMWFESEELYY